MKKNISAKSPKGQLGGSDTTPTKWALVGKKLLIRSGLAVGTLGIILAGASAFSAFEAHVVNVTATIENALTVPVEAAGLTFGEMFPQEVSHVTLPITLSASFMSASRVDDVEYMIRQKPKCGIPVPQTSPVQYSSFPQVTENADGTFACPKVGDFQSVQLPLLCPYLSKNELNADKQPTGNGIPAFHGLPGPWTEATTEATEVKGVLSKQGGKTSTNWDIDLHTPCFKGQCAQDWASFVHATNASVTDPTIYEADPATEHQMFGCDLWIEVSGISLPGVTPTPTPTPTPSVTPTPPGNLTIVKNTTGGDAQFNFTVTGPTASTPAITTVSGTGTTGAKSVTAGTYSVAETVPAGWTLGTASCNDGASSFSVNTVSGINVTPASNITCTFNDSKDTGTITVTKVVSDPGQLGGQTAGQFQMTIDGSPVAQGTPITVSTGNHTVSEVDNKGDAVTFSASCPAGVANVTKGANTNCTVTNTIPFITVTVTKVVHNSFGGTAVVGNFNLFVGSTQVTSGVSKNFAPGTYLISESGVSGYVGAFSGDCDSNTQQLTGAAGDTKVCTITNQDIEPNVTLIANVVNGSATANQFQMRIDNSAPVPSGSSKLVTSNTSHQIEQDAFAGYSVTGITGTGCPSALNTNFTLTPGQAITCTLNEHTP